MAKHKFGNDNPDFIIDYHATTESCSIRKTSDSAKMVNENSFDVKYKVLLLGDTLVGKTSLQRFIGGCNFRPNIGSTIGVDFINKIISVEKAKINLQIWDTAGQKNFRTIGRNYYSSTKAFVLVYDVTNEETFHLIEEFNQLIEQVQLDIERRYLVANKIDLVDKRKVDEDVGRRFALRNSMSYFETSCLTGENIQNLIEKIASDLVHQNNSEILVSRQPLGGNFVYNYNNSSNISNEILNKNIQQKRSSKNRLKLSSSSNFNIRRHIACCYPRRLASTISKLFS